MSTHSVKVVIHLAYISTDACCLLLAANYVDLISAASSSYLRSLAVRELKLAALSTNNPFTSLFPAVSALVKISYAVQFSITNGLRFAPCWNEKRRTATCYPSCSRPGAWCNPWCNTVPTLFGSTNRTFRNSCSY